MFRTPNDFRVRKGEYKTDDHAGRNGHFEVPKPSDKRLTLYCIASNGEGWEHVSVSIRDRKGNQANRIPTWYDMCEVKDSFWGPEDAVIQIHPRKSEYVNNHEFVLHLWRPTDRELHLPPPHLVGLTDDLSNFEALLKARGITKQELADAIARRVQK